jgi:hypothetical protein
LLVLLIDARAETDEQRAANAFFEKEVRPVLVNRCFDCHGEKKKKGSLRMDDISFIKEGGDSGPALVPGNPGESLMIKAIHRTDPDFEMPPKEALPPNEIAVLEKWVKLGAPWPANAGRPAVDQFGFTAAARAFWSFQPLADPKPPALEGNTWVRNDIDRFVAQKQAEMHLAPAPEAERRELVRRVYFDLHGLPPSQAEAEAFVQSKDPQAYEKLVDQLLAGPRYGERWAQHWLDLVRYAESDGYNQDAYRKDAWPYRDWVIRSLNNDLPYDQFVKQQLAGDELDPKNPDVIVATGYLRAPIYEYNQRDVKGQWDLIVNDMTDNASEVFLGLSYGCARCHDHKFDPILQKDYYRLKAFFAPVFWRDDMQLATEAQKAEYAKKLAEWEQATADIRKEMDAMTAKSIADKVRKAHDKFTEDLQAMLDKSFAERAPLERQLAGICERQLQFERGKDAAGKLLKKEDEKARYAELETQLKAFDALRPKPLPDAFVATDAAAEAPKVVLKTRKGEAEIAPGFLTLLAPGEAKVEPLPNSTGRRTALANWITRPDNQLTTRVIVNRIWAGHFGRGIVGTANDLGKLGEAPTHPELLDWLARRFVAEGWSLKKLHRDILLSATYRQTAHVPVSEVAAKTDPSNKYLWRFNPRRLDAEQIRDAMLMASGELDARAGGPATDGNGTRRSIYTMKKRNDQTELLRSLDAPAGFNSTPDRQSTTTPTQALLLVNGEWPLQRAQKLAARVSSPEEAWQLTLGRLPTAGEAEAARAFLQKKNAPATEPAPEVAVEGAGDFKVNSPHERLIARTTETEGDEFTVEAIFRLDSIDANAAVRTIASRWNGGKTNVESFGWSLGVTGEKSRFKPRNFIMQLVGEDENENITYEVVASDLRIELGLTYHVAARVSCSGHTVSFTVQDIATPDAPVLTSVKQHAVRGKLGKGATSLVIGGLTSRAPQHHWDGRIEAARIAAGVLPDEALTAKFADWKPGFAQWNAKVAQSAEFDWFGTDSGPAKTASSQSAMVDLCHVLLNANEFFYLH